MITGAHVLLFSDDADADRAFLADVLNFPSVDAGGGWLIFRLPPAEMAVHPTDGPGEPAAGSPKNVRAECYLICSEIGSFVDELRAKGVECSDLVDEGWGVRTSVGLPSGAVLGLYEPSHPTAFEV